MMVGSPWVIKNSISDMVQFDPLQIRFETFVNFRSSVYLTAGFITDVVSSDTAITNKKYVDEKSASALSEGKAYTDEKITLNQCLYVDGDGYVCVDYDKLPIINS